MEQSEPTTQPLAEPITPGPSWDYSYKSYFAIIDGTIVETEEFNMHNRQDAFLRFYADVAHRMEVSDTKIVMAFLHEEGKVVAGAILR